MPADLHEPRALAEVDERIEALSTSGWRASPAQLTRLLIGLWIFGTGDALLVIAELGNSPWTVFAAGVGEQTGMKVGTATIVVSFGVLLLWIPLRERPGLGTIANAIVIGLAIDATTAVLDTPGSIVARWALMLGGIALVGVGSGLYINAALGRGPARRADDRHPPAHRVPDRRRACGDRDQRARRGRRPRRPRRRGDRRVRAARGAGGGGGAAGAARRARQPPVSPSTGTVRGGVADLCRIPKQMRHGRLWRARAWAAVADLSRPSVHIRHAAVGVRRHAGGPPAARPTRPIERPRRSGAFP